MGNAWSVGVVVIGRNEGARLVRCLESLAPLALPVVYVDSGSSDGSAESATAMGAELVALPLDTPFTAGRARNAGFRRLLEIAPNLHFVQFVDGDCEVASDWIPFAARLLDAHPEVAIVCGRRKERYPERSRYNQLCDLEWDTPVGETDASGGDFLARADAFQAVGGFDPRLIAGEEPEMCHRLRRRGWRIYRADHLMTFHDAAMTRFSQWARRTSRSGYAYAARAALHWRDRTRFCWKENLRIAFWAAAFPLAVLLLVLLASAWWAALLIAYPLQYLRQLRRLRLEHPAAPVAAVAGFQMLGKWPEFYGQCLFLVRALQGREERIIEYK